MTLAELRTLVLNRLGMSSAETSVVSLIDSLLNEEYALLVAEERLAVERVSLVYTADDPLVHLPNGLLEIVSIATGDAVLRQTTREDMAQYGLGPADTGVAAYAFEPPNQIRLPWAPEENDNDGATLTYVPAPAEMTLDADEPEVVPSPFHRLLAERVIVILAGSEEEPFLVNHASAEADRLTRALRAHLGRRVGAVGPTITVRGLVPL